MYRTILRQLIAEAFRLKRIFPGTAKKIAVYKLALRREKIFNDYINYVTRGVKITSFSARPTMAAASRAKKRRYRRGITTVVAL